MTAQAGQSKTQCPACTCFIKVLQLQMMPRRLAGKEACFKRGQNDIVLLNPVGINPSAYQSLVKMRVNILNLFRSGGPPASQTRSLIRREKRQHRNDTS